jgi:hypothetical protein
MKTDEISLNPGIRPLIKADSLEATKDVVRQYYIAGGIGIELTPKQKEYQLRWEFADETIRQNMGKISRGAIAKIIATRMEISLATAKSDMTIAEEIMSSSNPLNKKHRIALRIEFMERQSYLAAQSNDFDAVAKIEKTISFYLHHYPETTTARPRRNVTYIIQNNIVNNNSIPAQEADDIIELELKKLTEQEHDDNE